MLFVLPALAEQAGARMYQWRDAVTGSLQLAGKPPRWYRNGEPGPRVKVFERGQLVDDTAQRIEPSQAAELRAHAFGGAPQTRKDPNLESPTSTIETPSDDAEALAHFKNLLQAWDRAQSTHAAPAANDSSSPAPLPPQP
jgi:hypothetical protein